MQCPKCKRQCSVEDEGGRLAFLCSARGEVCSLTMIGDAHVLATHRTFNADASVAPDFIGFAGGVRWQDDAAVVLPASM